MNKKYHILSLSGGKERQGCTNKQHEYHILSLSGGKDSTALAFFIKENMPEIHEKIEYVFCDTECELPELYDYLDKIELFLGKKITRIKPKVGFEQIYSVYGYLPHPAKRWCTVELKTKPFQKFLKNKSENFKYKTVLYIGIRADERHRVDSSTSKYENIVETFPFVEYCINKDDVIKILDDVGIGLADFYSWKRRSGCYFCFFQNKMDWILLNENYPELYKKAMSYEHENCEKIKKGHFGWNYQMPLHEIIKPENVQKIKKQYAKIYEKNKSFEKTTLINLL